LSYIPTPRQNYTTPAALAVNVQPVPPDIVIYPLARLPRLYLPRSDQ